MRRLSEREAAEQELAELKQRWKQEKIIVGQIHDLHAMLEKNAEEDKTASDDPVEDPEQLRTELADAQREWEGSPSARRLCALL